MTRSVTLAIPGDKSLSHRALLFSSLLHTPSTLHGVLPSADVLATQRCLSQLGTVFETVSSDPTSSGVLHDASSTPLSIIRVVPQPWHEPDDVLMVDNSGTSIRLLAGLLAAQPFMSVLTGDAAIRRRPMARVILPLQHMGAAVTGRANNTLAPLVIQPAAKALNGLRYESPVASAQVKSAVLLAGLYAEQPVLFHEPVTSRDHTERFLRSQGVDLQTAPGGWLTLAPRQIEVLRQCAGIDWTIPGDMSSAAFFMVLASLTPGLTLTLPHVGLNPARTGIMTTLQAMGASIVITNRRDEWGEPIGDIVVTGGALSGHVTLTAEDIPGLVDEIPVLMVAGALLDGSLTVQGAEELRAKESDRLAAMGQAFDQLGILITMTPDGFTLTGNPRLCLLPPNQRLLTHHDHRIVMSLAILNALTCPSQPWPIEGPEWVNVSFPNFFTQLDAIKR
jgi:3-phosphoshikimate 1-carboxyvinyltransferase